MDPRSVVTGVLCNSILPVMIVEERSLQNTGNASFYRYNPSLAVAIVAAVLYGIAFILTFVQWIRYKSWVWVVMVVAAASKFTITPLYYLSAFKLISLTVEAVGYIGRCISTQNVTDKPVYVLQFALIILAPVLMAACCYVLFSRILFLIVPREERTFRLCWVPPKFITPLFVGFDVVALFLQLVGAVMISSVDSSDTDVASKLNRGKHIAQAGVIVQLIAFGLFSVAAVRFNFTSKRFTKTIHERYEMFGERDYIVDGITKKKHWPALLRVVNLTTLLILVSVYEIWLEAIPLTLLLYPPGPFHLSSSRVY